MAMKGVWGRWPGWEDEEDYSAAAGPEMQSASTKRSGPEQIGRPTMANTRPTMANTQQRAIIFDGNPQQSY